MKMKDKRFENGPDRGKVEEEVGEDARPSPEEATDEVAGAHAHEEVMVAEGEPSREDGLIRDLEELQDRHLRLAAEFENYRKRTRRELAEMRRRAQAELVRDLLDVLDDLSRVAHAADDATVESVRDGIGLVEAKMRKELGEAGMERIEAAGQVFNPNLHEALATQPTDDPEKDDTVSNVLVDGYTLGDILIRPARVQVNKYTPPASQQPVEEPREGDEG